MMGKILGAWLGRKAADRYGNSGLKGALIGAGAGAVARRGLGPIALVAGGAWVARKLLDRRRSRGGSY